MTHKLNKHIVKTLVFAQREVPVEPFFDCTSMESLWQICITVGHVGPMPYDISAASQEGPAFSCSRQPHLGRRCNLYIWLVPHSTSPSCRWGVMNAGQIASSGSGHPCLAVGNVPSMNFLNLNLAEAFSALLPLDFTAHGRLNPFMTVIE